MKSVFTAIPLEGDAKSVFQELQQRFVSYADILTLQKPETPHITLTYWKEVMDIEYNEIVRQAARVAELSTPFELPVIGADAFSGRAIFLNPVFSPELANLKKRCPWPNDPGKPFHPHVTIARIRHPGKFQVHKKDIMKLLKDAELVIHVDRIRLYANIDGVSQTPLKDFAFAGQA